jgi:hypothetical protein
MCWQGGSIKTIIVNRYHMKNIFQDVPKGIDFVLCMLIIYAKILGQTIHNFTFHKNINLIFIIIEVIV